jgi:bla regulator protein BlaR1
MEFFLRVGLGNVVAAGVLALGAASVGAIARRRPALRHGLWLLVLLKLVTPPLWTVPVAWVSTPVEAGAGPVPGLTLEHLPDGGLDGLSPLEEEPQIEPDAQAGRPTIMAEPAAYAALPWGGWLLAAWGGGTLLTAGVAARRIRRFQGLLRLAEPASEPMRVQVEALAGRLGLRHAPGVWLVPGAVSPMLWALGCRPRLIVPTALWDRLDERQRATLLAHELAHLKRRDHWVRCLELLVTGLYWWFPLVWIARHALREAEEQCCDAWVVWAFPDAARTYAGALLEAVDFLSGIEPALPLAASGLGQFGHLKRRMTMIMQGTTPRALTWSGLLAVLGLSATLLPLSPTWAQRPENEETPASAPDKPEARDPGPRPERERSDATPSGPEDRTVRRRVRTETWTEERDEERPEAPGPGEARNPEDPSERRKEVIPPTPRRRGPEAGRDDRESDERMAEVKQLRAEVEMRRKELFEAERRFSQAIKQLAEREAKARTLGVLEAKRFEVRINKPGPEGMQLKFIPRPDQEKRMAELEERLEKLQDEVKTLKRDTPLKR